MAIVYMGNASAQRQPHHTCRARVITHVYPPLIMSVTPSPRKSPKVSMSNDAVRGVARWPSAVHESSNGNLVMKIPDPLHHHLGELKENSTLYTQQYVIRSYDVGVDKATPITTIFNLFQDMSLCHFNRLGIAATDGLGATKGMHSLGLIWILAKVHVQVLSFPRWPDVIEIDGWFGTAGKNSMRYEWLVRRSKTKEVLVRATSIWCVMNSKTRRLCKMPDVVREELDPFFIDDRYVFEQRDIISTPIAKLDDLTAQCTTSTIKSCRTDLDGNQHVTNARYISWLLQSVPDEHMETHDLKSISIEYRRECGANECLESLTTAKRLAEASHSSEGKESKSECELTHLLRTRDAAQRELVRATTTWRPKSPAHSEMIT